jgi:uncharacterized protein (DUF1697 family)
MKYAAFLRAINVSGKNIIKMDSLKELFSESGFSDVAAYLQSGNVVFSYKSSPINKLEEIIESAIHKIFGMDIKVIVRSENDIKKIIADNVFLAENPAIEFIYVTLFKNKLKFSVSDLINSKKDAEEKFYISSDCIYLYCPNGYGRTKINNNNLEKWSENAGTTRNWKTILAIKELLG